MKVFISWSGELSKKLGETIRDWLPAVIQAITPYFTPSDIEKGARWPMEIAKELSDCQIGILCITQDNIHSDWILFEAGALSKSLEKSNVCPILFGILNTDLSGPLKQFQTTLFDKSDFLKLLGVINERLKDHKLPQKTLDKVFEKWWPDLNEKIQKILSNVQELDEPIRSDREILEEILQINRDVSIEYKKHNISPNAIKSLLKWFIELHNEKMNCIGSHQDTLNSLKKMHKSVNYIAKKYYNINDELDSFIDSFQELKYSINCKNDSYGREIDFDGDFHNL